MHHRLYTINIRCYKIFLTMFCFSFAVDHKLNVMTPKNESITEDDIGGDELSAMDIKKLNYAYYCDGKTKARKNKIRFIKLSKLTFFLYLISTYQLMYLKDLSL